MKKMSMDEIKQCEINILNYLVAICKENKLRYFLAYGSTLGAIRHQGFIPWDDDIDVMMPRQDFEKLISLQDGESLRYEILSCNHDKNFDAPLAKIIDKRTLLYQAYGQVDKKQLGVYIDIFILDGLPENLKKSEKFCSKAKLLQFVWGLSVRKWNSKSRNVFIGLIKTIISFPFRILGGNFFSRLLYRYSGKYSYEEAEYAGVVCFGEGNKKERIKKSDIEPGVEVTFEKEKYVVPSNWNKYLENIYGDYMQLPPIEQRLSKHNFSAYFR